MFEREKIISYSKTLKGTEWVVEGFQDEDMRLEGESDQVRVHLAPQPQHCSMGNTSHRSHFFVHFREYNIYRESP